jgi:DNA-binding MarR family transcriptional regulator
MPLVLRSSLEHRIIGYASEHYPLLATELARALKVTDEKIMLELRKMESKGMVELDILPDKVFVRLLVVAENGKNDGGKDNKQKRGGDDPAYL